MKVRLTAGRKGPGDQIVLVSCDGCRCGAEEQLTYEAVAHAVKPLMENEERLYPSAKGNRGYKLLLDFLDCAYRNDVPAAMRLYRLETSRGSQPKLFEEPTPRRTAHP